MTQISKSRWVGAAIVASLALVGMNASAVRAVEGFVQVASGANCTNPPGFQYVVLATGTTGPNTGCRVEVGVGATATSNCDTSFGGGTLRAEGGTLNLSTMVFTSSGVATSAPWFSNQTTPTAQWAPAAGCILQGNASSRN